MKRMVMIPVLALLALTLSGCLAQCSYTWRPFTTEDGDAVGTVLCENTQYKLLFWAPITAGTPWESGPIADWHRGITWFRSRNLVNDNMKMVRLAQQALGGTRVGEIRTEVDTMSAWSLFLVKREVFRTSAVILK